MQPFPLGKQWSVSQIGDDRCHTGEVPTGFQANLSKPGRWASSWSTAGFWLASLLERQRTSQSNLF